MKKNDWNEGMNHLDPDLVEEYVVIKEACTGRNRRKSYWITAVAAVLVLAISIGILAGGNGIPGGTTGPAQLGSDPTTERPSGPIGTGLMLASPVYPYMAPYPNANDYTDWDAYNADYDAWLENRKQQYDQPNGYADSLTGFFHESIAQFLQGDGNPTYSPVNVYLAMSMLAETTDGNSRKQILDLFGLNSIVQLREQASYVWNAHYCQDGQTSMLLANSLWLNDQYTFRRSTADLLAECYYASSFSGDLGSDGMNKMLYDWLNENTGGLLKQQAENIYLDPETVFALASTVYFTASWKDEFSERLTKDDIFHSPEGDLTVSFMNKTINHEMVYWGDHFKAMYLKLTGDNRMWLILPDEGYTVAQILESDDYLKMTMDPGAWEKKGVYMIHLSLPKFDVDHQMDLIQGMQAMGVTDIFDHRVSNFTPITETPSLYVSKINHAARVAIDEKGCVGAAFTVIQMDPGTAPGDGEELSFVLDRPFLFLVSSQDHLPLFVGVVNEP